MSVNYKLCVKLHKGPFAFNYGKIPLTWKFLHSRRDWRDWQLSSMPRYASEIGSSESGSRFSVSKVANLLLQGLRFFSSSLQAKHQHVWFICTSQHMLESTLCLYTWRSNTAMHVEIILLVFVYLTNTIWVDPSTWTFEDHNEKSSQRWEIYQVSHALYSVHQMWTFGDGDCGRGLTGDHTARCHTPHICHTAAQFDICRPKSS